MDQKMGYARTSDGVTIAYATMGSGPPILWIDLPYSHIHAELADPNTRETYENNAKVSTFIRYDHRGFGLSDRTARDFSLDAFVRDIEAVVDTLGLTRFSVSAWRGITTPVAVAYAARHPERVTHLVLALGAARMPPRTHDAIAALIKASDDWRFVTESISRVVQGWDNDEASRHMALLLRESIDQDAFAEFWEAAAAWDVRDLLPQIQTRTLLVHWRDHPLFGPEYGRELAGLIPNAQAGVIDGTTPAVRNTQYQMIFRSFFGVAPPYTNMTARSEEKAGTAILVFADIVDSTSLTEQLGDAVFRQRARELDSSLREIVTRYAGRPIDGKLLGDGILATFTAASAAVNAALGFEEAAHAVGLELHVGIHAGDVIHEGDNVYGGAVNIAARIAAASAPGEVLVSDTVRALARTSAGVTFADRGEHALKGIDEPHRLYAAQRG